MTRVQIEMPDERVQELDGLMADTNLRTRTDLIENALTLFEWAVEESRAGRRIASVDESNQRYREVLMPSLQRVGRTKMQRKSAKSPSPGVKVARA